MTPDKLTEELRSACPQGLTSVILYGSAAAGDHTGKRSDYNVLVITEDLGLSRLNALSKAAAKWARAGNPAPLLFTEERLKQASDVFPIELLDIKECHQVLHGSDLVADLKIDTKNLRLQIEHELRGKLIKLRQHYLLTTRKPKAVADLMIESLSSFLVLFRATLRLFDADVPMKKLDALEKLATYVEFDVSVFKTIQQLKDGSIKSRDIAVDDLFGNYLITIESVIDAVDAYVQGGEQE